MKERIKSLLVKVHEVLLGDDADRPEKYNYLVKEVLSDKTKTSGRLVDKEMQLDKLNADDYKFKQTILMGEEGFAYQCPPLHLAVWLMRRNWVVFLLDADADPLLKDSLGRTAVDVAIYRSGEVLESDPHEWKGSCSQDQCKPCPVRMLPRMVLIRMWLMQIRGHRFSRGLHEV